MVYLLIKQSTIDINSWKKSFDRFIEYRRIGGEVSCEIYQAPRKRNEIIVLSEWNSMDDVIEFLESQSFQMIKDLEKDEPLTVQFLNKQSFGQFIEELN